METYVKKAPYLFDLEVIDRKPDIIPKVGDKVKIKSREWHERWKDPDGNVPVDCSFVRRMSIHCGHLLTVTNRWPTDGSWRFNLKEDENAYTWTPEMFEEVYPQGTFGDKDLELQTIKRHRFIKLEKL